MSSARLQRDVYATTPIFFADAISYAFSTFIAFLHFATFIA